MRVYQSLGGFTDWVGDVVNAVKDFGSTVAATVSGVGSWVGEAARNKVKAFRSQLTALNEQEAYLSNHYPKSTASQKAWDDYNAIYGAVLDTQAKAETVNDQIKKVEKQFGIQLSGLGLLPALEIPAVVVAGIIGASYLLAKTLDLVQLYYQRTSYANSVAASGGDVAGALASFDAKNKPTGGGGLFGDLSQLLWPVAIIGGVYLFSQNRGRG